MDNGKDYIMIGYMLGIGFRVRGLGFRLQCVGLGA